MRLKYLSLENKEIAVLLLTSYRSSLGMFKRRCACLKGGILWLIFWLAFTMFVYINNVIYLVENVGTSQGQFLWQEIGKQREKVALPVKFTRSVMHKGADSFNNKVLMDFSVHDKINEVHRNVTYKIMYDNATYRALNKRNRLSHNNTNKKLILFYNPSNFQRVRNITNARYTFEGCEVRNCRVSFDQNDANISDAVIFHWFKQYRSYPKFVRPGHQVWIFIQHEPTRSYARNATLWRLYHVGMQKNFNWTMTYSKKSDIHLPYGVMKRKPGNMRTTRDYLKIAKSKTKDALWIVSRCPTSGRREEYVNILRKYIDVEILGACGRKWNCGVRSNHPLDNCFSVLNNTYRYYLAFENDLCEDYVTEKFFENYEYDILQVVRAGHPLKRPVNIDKNAYIDTKDFKNATELGKFLQKLSRNVTQYAKMLATKDKYMVIPYVELFKDSMCNICKRLNNLKDHKYVYDDVYKWVRKRQPCYSVPDIG